MGFHSMTDKIISILNFLLYRKTFSRDSSTRKRRRKPLRYQDTGSQNINSMRYDALNHAQGYPQQEEVQ